MPRNIVSAQDFVCDRISFLEYSAGDTNAAELRRMREILLRAMHTELTELQRYCLIEYYLRGRKMKDIADVLGLNPSTVTRHIRRAKDKLRHIAGYYH